MKREERSHPLLVVFYGEVVHKMSRRRGSSAGLTSLLDILFSTFGAVIVMAIVFASRAFAPPIDLDNHLEVSCQILGPKLTHNPHVGIQIVYHDESGRRLWHINSWQPQAIIPDPNINTPDLQAAITQSSPDIHATLVLETTNRSYLHLDEIKPGNYDLRLKLGSSLPIGQSYQAECRLLGKICRRSPKKCKPQMVSLTKELESGSSIFASILEPIRFQRIEIKK